MSARTVLVVLLVATLLRLVFVVFTTADEKDRDVLFVGYNDERAHHNYVRYLAEHARLPVQTARITDPDAFERYEFEYHQPPLYYALAAPFHLAGESIRAGWGLYAVRLFSLMLALATLALAYRFVERFVEAEGAALGITLFLALLLGHARFASQVNNDNLLWLLALAVFYLMFRDLERGGPETRTWLVAGALSGLALLTKSSFLTLMAGPPLALLLRRTDGRTLGATAAYLGCAGALALPWWLRNVAVYGEPLATSVGVGEPRSGVGFAFLEELYRLHLQRAAFGFWSGFENTFPRPQQQLLVKLLGAAMLGILLFAARHWLRRMRDAGSWRRERPRFWGLLAAAAGNLAGMVWYAYRYQQGEIRLLFPSLAALVYLVLAPLYAGTAPGRHRWITAGLALCALLPWIGFVSA